MSTQQLIQAHIDSAITEKASALLADMGLTVSDALRLLLIKVAEEEKLPFDTLVPNATTLAAIEEARGGSLPRFTSVQALMDSLNAHN